MSVIILGPCRLLVYNGCPQTIIMVQNLSTVVLCQKVVNTDIAESIN